MKKKTQSIFDNNNYGEKEYGRGKEELKSGGAIGEGVRKGLREEIVEQRSEGGEGEKHVDI